MANMSRPDDIARAEAQRQQAEADRIAAEAQRDIAWNVAADQTVNRDIADAQTVDARIAANQANRAAAEADTQRNILNDELRYERAAASSNAFGFYLTLGILVAALIVVGFYLYWRSNNPDTVTVNAAPVPAPVVVTQPPALSAPPVVNVPPPVVHNHISVQPPANPSATGSPGSDNAGTSNSGESGAGGANTNGGGAGTGSGNADGGTQNNNGSQ